MQANFVNASNNAIAENISGKARRTIEKEKSKEGIKEYPILDFKVKDLEKLRSCVEETLKHSKIKPAGGQLYEISKRAFDIVLSSAGIVMAIIPVGCFALAIYLNDGGNPIFSQVRLTKNGKPFKMYKLRSMCIDAEEKFAEVQKANKCDGLAFKSEDDPRITPIGRFIRKTSIDELPQLFNVLKGDMSIIGPRPPLPREVVLYTPKEMDRLLVKGGLACVCQTEGRSDMSFDEWMHTDIEYIKNRSMALDMKILIKMIIAVIKRKGAE
ncbi:MAG: sugar transferase [Ruminococcus flavefaciens]|nr:sugar transferase [Ruminococcus flavefaciens]